MSNGIFIGLSESELLAIRTKAVALITEGKTTMSYSPGDGSSFSKQFSMPPKEVLMEVRHALQLLDPATYGKRTTVIRTNWQGFEYF
jgi:uncharacterized protein with von Willebrand factor type A (vWA) domain